ncbi:uncharacterized protein LOC131212730 [Anopheles bellator]|uniref:uncharacterized protein LOC131212730 n=1 Tax=Anopheles bellator TaxID=139047 RepID=UPI0026484ABB|nr:uncharacterized protein LOC131212730 [Anopheles bellator]
MGSMANEKKRQAIESLFALYAVKQGELTKQYDSNRKKRCKIFLQRLRYTLKRNGESHQTEWNQMLENVLLDSVPTRKFWKLTRNDNWFRSVFECEDNTEVMLQNFRMDRETFDMLVETLKQDMAPHPLLVSQSCSTEKKVAVGLYKLAMGGDYATIGEHFGVHKATVKNCVFQFCKAMVKYFMDSEISLPLGEEMVEIARSFEEKCELPMIMGVLGKIHIPITPSAADSKNYINPKKWHSLILQGVVDNNYVFRHITCGHVGCTEEGSVLGDSGLYQHFNNVELPSQVINENVLQAYIVGEPSYPLLPWLVHGYINTPLSQEEETFNEHLAKARRVVDDSFNRLRARFKILQKKIDIDVNFVPQILLTCCILHNIIEKRKLPMKDEWLEAVKLMEPKYPQPDSVPLNNYTTTLEGDAARDVLKDHIQSKYMLFRTFEYGQVYFINESNN